MAKKKKRTRSRRRSTMAGVGNTIMPAVAVIAGAAAGRLAATKIAPTMNDKLKNGLLIAVGLFVVPKISRGAVAQAAGMGVVAAGGLGLLQSFNVLSGVDDIAGIEDGDTAYLGEAGEDELSGVESIAAIEEMEEFSG